MKIKILASLGMGLFILSCSHSNKPNAIELSRSTVKIQALSANGKQSIGSGVLIAPNIIATNCHVTRTANLAYLIEEDRLYPVLAQAAIPEFDVCILKTEPLTLLSLDHILL